MVSGSLLVGFILGGILLYRVGTSTAVRRRAVQDHKTVLAGVDKVTAALKEAGRVQFRRVLLAVVIGAALLAGVARGRDGTPRTPTEPSPPGTQVAEVTRR